MTSRVIGSMSAPPNFTVSCPAEAGHPVTAVTSVELMLCPSRASVVTGSPLSRAMTTLRVGSAPPAPDADLAERSDLETIARPDQGRGAVFFDQSRPGSFKARRERGAVEYLCIQSAAHGAEINRS